MGPTFFLLFLQFHTVCLLTYTTKILSFSLPPHLPSQKVPVNHSVHLENEMLRDFFTQYFDAGLNNLETDTFKLFQKMHVYFSSVPFRNVLLAQEVTAILALQRC